MHSGETDLLEDEDDDKSLDEDSSILLQHCIKQLKSFWHLVRSKEENDKDPTTFQAQFKLTNYWQRITQLMTVPRTPRACLAAFVVMLLQQLCAINILAFYSTTLFRDSDRSSETLTEAARTRQTRIWLHCGIAGASA
jgi:hypothetical protein